MHLLRKAAVSLCHRLGLFEYLRGSWRSEFGKERDSAATVERAVAKLQRSVTAMEQSLTAELNQLRGQLKKLACDTRTLQTLIAVDQGHHPRWNRLDATLDETMIRSSVTRALAGAVFETVPMPHAVLRDVLPAATYDAVLEAIPGAEFFPDKDPIKQNIKIHQLDMVPAWTRRALTYLDATIIGAILAPAIVSRMRPYLDAIYRAEYGPAVGPLVAALPHGATAGRLMLRRPGYKLEPHLDPRRVAITCLIYFARPGDDARYGTELFEVDRPLAVNRSTTFYPRDNGYQCRLIKTVPFEPNTALVFLNRDGAHAAEIPRDAPRETRRYAYQFYISPDQAAVEALVVHSSQARPKPAAVFALQGPRSGGDTEEP